MRTCSPAVFLRRINRRANEKGFPLRVMFEVTYRCNFRCKHCYVPQAYRRRRELSTGEVFRVIDRLAEAGCFYLGLTGGEPLMRWDIFTILAYAKSKGLQVMLNTNGSLVDRAAADALAALGVNKVDITLPAASNAVFDRISGVKHSGERVYRAVGLLHRRNIPLGFKSCVLKDNEHEIGKIQQFCRSLGCNHRLDELLMPRLDGTNAPYDYRGRYSNLPGRVAGCAVRSKGRGQRKSPSALFACGAGTSQAAITPAGKLKICLMIEYPGYDILKRGFAAVWKKMKTLVGGIRPDSRYRCGTCSVRRQCSWCPGRSWLYNRTFTSCDPQNELQALQRQAQQQGRRSSTTPVPLPAGKR